LTRPSGFLIVFDIILPGAKPRRPFLNGSETQRFLSGTFRKFGSNLLIRLLAKNGISNHRPLLHQK
jgi:hypothetical protein